MLVTLRHEANGVEKKIEYEIPFLPHDLLIIMNSSGRKIYQYVLRVGEIFAQCMQENFIY